ncbi:MAG: hypothetical protein ACFFEN_16230 [Candidatus Thorarchaeota archaeon]
MGEQKCQIFYIFRDRQVEKRIKIFEFDNPHGRFTGIEIVDKTYPLHNLLDPEFILYFIESQN